MEHRQDRLERVVFLVNEQKPQAVAAAKTAARALSQAGVCFFAPETATVELPAYAGGAHAELAHDLSQAELAAWPQLAVIFGGDGTLIAAARMLAPFGIPIAGVNLGQLGFLMSLEVTEMPENLLKMVRGDYYLEPRMQIAGELWRGGSKIVSAAAQNDIVINNGSISRMIGISLWVDNQLALEMKGDGVVVATPTGSTAYSLSAGGSIVPPETEVMLITPVAAHSLYSRPLVVSAGSVLRLQFANVAGSAKVAFDGQLFCDVQAGDEVIIEASDHKALFAWPRPDMFFSKLKAKLTV